MAVGALSPKALLFARELAFVLLVLAALVIPWLVDIASVPWLALGALLAFSLVNPKALLFAVPAAVAISFRQFEAGNMQLNVLEILVTAAVVGYAPRAAIGLWRQLDYIRDNPGEFGASIVPDRLATGISLLLLLTGLVSLFTLADPDYARESLRTFRWTIFFPVAYFVLASAAIQSATERLFAGALFIAGASVAAVIALVDGLLGGGVQADAVVRLSGLAPHPNALALVLDRAAIFAILMTVLYRSRASGWWAAGAVLVTLVTALTFSRGALLAVIVGCLAILSLSRARNLALGGGAVAAVTLLVITTLAPSRTLSFLGGGSGSLRLELWKSSVAMIRDHPVTGVGLDQFLYQYLPRYVSPEAWPERFTSHPHNVLLDVWLSLGIIGPVILALIVVLWVRHVRVALRNRDRISLAAGGALVGLFVHGLVDQTYFLPELAISMWFLVLLLKPSAAEPSAVAAPGYESEG